MLQGRLAIFRINYKSDFIITLNSDAGWMTPFCIKFWTGAPSQAYFAGWDGTTYTNCAPVAGEPTKLQVQFDDHHLPIGELKYQIGYHFTIADFPTTVEDEVLNQERIVISHDGQDEKVLLDFNGETAPDIQFSLPAYANEAQRIANEEQRIANEAIRIVNEEVRIVAEQNRQQNEEQRIAQETARVQEFARLKRESESATSDANAAATLANEKAQLAADKAALAQSAADLANAKALLAEYKAALAASAAQLANDKAALAQQKAEYAQTQGTYAKNQGDYAKQQGDYAKDQGDTALADHLRAEADHETAASDHTRAESDHSTASSDHTQASTDHSTATSDHSTAAADHTQAGTDHTRAESDHSTAASDHTTAGNDHTRAESDHTRAESDHAAVEVYVDSLGAYDISAAHAVGGVLATYANLQAALGTNGANIPEGIRKGGMSVKFIQGSAPSSDNKYIQFRCMTQNFTTDTTQWAISDEGVYVENPKFVYIKTDNEDKILWAIKKDGDIYYGAGCPQQIKDYIKDKISSLSLDEYEDIVAFLSDYLGSDTTLKAMIDGINAQIATKVDKVEGKSLINLRYAEGVSYVENPEFIEVSLDAEDKILWAIKANGDIYYGAGVPSQVVNYINEKIAELSLEDIVTFLNNLEKGDKTLQTLLDEKVDKEEGKSLIDTEYANGVRYIENPGFVAAYLDYYNKILFGVKNNGDFFFGYGVPTQVVEYINKSKAEILAEILAELNTKVDKETGKSLIQKEVADNISVNDNPDFCAIEKDSYGNILGGRKKDGTKVECVGLETPNISTSNLNLDAKGLQNFKRVLANSGFTRGFSDWSNYLSNDGAKPLKLSIPEFAIINFDTNVWPRTKTADAKCHIEFYDMNGNYFKKPIIFNAQGNSTMIFEKKNGAIDLFDSEWEGDAFKIQFGDWVSQDSFHLKANYTDFFRGSIVCAYQFVRAILKTRGIEKDTQWKRAILPKYDIDTNIYDSEEINDLSVQLDDGARCMPDGFPCAVYLNDNFYGLYSLQLKKHRDNYNMSKSNPNNIHLDGNLAPATIWSGVIDWTKFEIRNPKNLVYASAHNNSWKYDADVAQAEIAGNSDGSTEYDIWASGSYNVGDIVKHNNHIFINTKAGNTAEPVYDKKKNGDDAPDFKNKTGCYWLNITNTVKVKNAIIQLSHRIGEINAAKQISDDNAKAVISQYFDVENIIDYEIASTVLFDYDAFAQNWQWCTWDGIKWFVCDYDKDRIFGSQTSSIAKRPNAEGSWYHVRQNDPTCIISLYDNEAKQRYQQLIELGIINPEYIIELFNKWTKRIGKDYFKLEYNKWSDSPCNRESKVDSHWKLIDATPNITTDTTDYDAEHLYNVGDECHIWHPNNYLYTFEAIEATINNYPIAGSYNKEPKYFGYRDNIWRLHSFIEDWLSKMETFINN